jgi:anthranilate/para-aminobenzoate synthase component I
MRLEKVPRNVYTGTIGFISFNGKSEFNSAFRTMVLKDTIGYLHAGTEVGTSTDAEEAYVSTVNSAERIFGIATHHI